MVRRVVINLYIALCVAIASCSTDNTEYMWVSVDEVRLSSQSGSEATFSIESNSDWSIEVVDSELSSAISLSRSSGTQSATVAVVSTIENETNLLLDLGQLCITSRNGSTHYIEVKQRRVAAPQTTLMIFTGTSLRTYFNSNIADIKEAITNGDMGDNGRMLYVMSDSSNSSNYNLYEIALDGDSQECTSQIIKSYSNISWNNSDVMAQIISDAKSEAEISDDGSNTINLILSGHGTGWVLKEHTSLTRLTTASDGTIAYTSMWEPENPQYQMRFMGSSTDGFFDIEELQTAIEQSNTKFGYILFDECLMSSIELLYRLRNCSDYIIASPAEVMAAGFPYTRIFKYMFDNNGTDFDVEKICEEYINSYNESSAPYATVAACVTSELESLALTLSDIDWRDVDDDTRGAIQSYEGLTNHVFYDLGDYVTQFGVGDLTNFYTIFDRAFPLNCRLHTSKFFSSLGYGGAKTITTYYGVSTSAPSIMFNDDWALEPWVIATGQNN